MPDYGHDVRFGAFITPDAGSPDDVVDLAVAAEQAGLDLVTFQDHPYNPRLLDAWTLLTWVAARTSTVEVAGNVLNLPLRPPATLARAAAALDLLSGGRVAMGLGAGGFWDPIEGMGGGRLTPGESVDALSEAVDVLRELWRGDLRTPLRSVGKHHPVPNARRGPTPAHQIPIWLGAYKPRMLRLTGAKADGWLPSLGYLDPADIAGSQAIIDDAAREAGRDPREIRRLINVSGLTGGPADWVDQLVSLVLEHGFDTLILAADDPASLAVFGREVGPAVREAVTRERTTAGTAPAPTRSQAALSQRVPGIDYDAVPDSVRDVVVEPGDFGYASVRHSYVHRGSPALVIRARSATEVADALAFARDQGVPISVRSGGHGISGRSTNDGGVVIDLGAMNQVSVTDAEGGLVRVGPGARWGEVAAALSPYGLAVTSGDSGDVGVGGLATAGGIGFLSRSQGLTVDRVVGAEVVLADGQVVYADADHHPDLFWGLRGAGGNLGIVTSFDLAAAPVGTVVVATLLYDASQIGTWLPEWSATLVAAPRELTGFLTAIPARSGQPPIAHATLVYAAGDVDAARRALTPFLGIAPVLNQRAQLAPYAAVVPAHGGTHTGGSLGLMRSAMLDEIGPDVASVAAELFLGGDSGMMQFRAVGGAVNDVASDATAFAHRSQNFLMSAVALPGRDVGFESRWDQIESRSAGAYLSFETDPGRLPRIFPGPTLDRLVSLKATYDPDHVFDLNMDIPTDGAEAGLSASSR